MSALDQILALLTGRKVYDPTTHLWRVYDNGGVEIADVGGVLQRGLHGWLLWTNAYGQFTAEIDEDAQYYGGGGRRYQFIPYARAKKPTPPNR